MIFRRQAAVVGALLGSALFLTGCSSLPASGPGTYAISGGATVVGASEDGTVGLNYVLLDVSKQSLPLISEDSNGDDPRVADEARRIGARGARIR